MRLLSSAPALRFNTTARRGDIAILALHRASLFGFIAFASASSVCVPPGFSASIVRSRSRLAAVGLRYAQAMPFISRPLQNLRSCSGEAGSVGCATSNPALNLAPSGRWTLRIKAAQRRLALR